MTLDERADELLTHLQDSTAVCFPYVLEDIVEAFRAVRLEAMEECAGYICLRCGSHPLTESAHNLVMCRAERITRALREEVGDVSTKPPAE